ncbi:MAG: PAS domain S-box protein [Candidatus Colwellbacteria bacterium]|nr:PAS domain S-box protein [Candidatus Colwellbacteria bacterium]
MLFYLLIIVSLIAVTLGVVLALQVIKLKKISAEAKEIKGYLADIVDNLADGVVVYDNDFKVLVFNPGAERIFGVSASDIIGKKIGPERIKDKNLKTLVQVVFPSLAPQVVERTEEGSNTQIADLSFTDPELELRVYTAALNISEGENGFVKVIRDMTREIGMLKSKSEFITVAAHQLRTPLTGVLWAFDILRKSNSVSLDDKDIAEQGLGSAKALSKIVNDMLDVSKIEEGKFGYKFENIDIIKFLTSSLQSASIFAKRAGVNLYFDKGGEAPLPLKADPEKLGLAISNFVDNAIKYNVQNGSVTVKIERLEDKPYIQVSIKDTGIGVPAEEIDKLFKKFFRAKNASAVQTVGSGLGLYIARNIILQHGGTVWAESTLGKGTTFYLTLPTDPNLIPKQETVYE